MHASLQLELLLEEEQQFGGIPVEHGELRWVRWPRRELLRTYVLKHLLVHEVGHHLAPPDLDEDADEQWAERFAFHFYDPGGRGQQSVVSSQ